MAAFRYEALDAANRSVSGVVLADTARQARAQLRAQGLLPSLIERTQARDGARPLWARGLSSATLSLLTRQLATLLQAGLTMERALDALIEDASEPLAREVLIGVKAEVTAGSSLAGALGAHERSFPDFYRALVHGGEESGALSNVLEQLADYLDARQALLQKTTLALIYPALVSGVALVIVTGLLVYVVPQVVDVFQQSRQSLPALTRGLIGLSNFLRDAWPYLIVLIAAGAVATRFALRREAVRRRWHALILRLPWLGSLARSVNTSRFASTLAIMVGGGVPLLAALASCSQATTNMLMREAIERATDRVREGSSLARAFGDTGVFPPLLVHLVASGEASGKLEQMLQRAARLETQALERRLAIFLTVLEPVMVLALGGMVLLIVLAILLPIIQINQLVR
jgi:general secretion pathway protein F